jgi:hypothetical protein
MVGNKLKIPAAIAGSTLALAGCGEGNGIAYDSHTETALAHVIRPAMTKIASEAIRLATKHPDLFDKTFDSKNGVVVLEGTTLAHGNMHDITVITKPLPGTHNPDVNQVVIINAQTDLNPSGKKNIGPITVDDEYQFSAPGSDSIAKDNDLDTHDKSNRDGWNAYEDHIVAKGQDVDFLLSGTVSTASKSDFAVDAAFNPTDALTTAKDIVNDYNQSKDLLELDFAGGS